MILRAAVGGTGFLDDRWKLTDDLYLHMIEMIRTALELNKNNHFMGLLWHQGETDAQLKAAYDVHYKNLMQLLDSVRKELGVPELPFIAGDFVHHWKNENIEDCTPVIEAVKAVIQECGHGAFVETDGLLSNFQELHRETMGWEDTIHFSRKSLYILGKRYFEAFVNLTQ